MKKIFQQSGFTFTEVIAVVAISAVLAGISTPFIKSYRGEVTAETVHAEFSKSLLAAREASVSLGKSVSMCPSVSGTKCDTTDWSQGWLTYVGTSASSLAVGLEVLESKSFAQASIPVEVINELFVNQDRIEFTYRGFSAGEQSLLVSFCYEPNRQNFSSLMVERSGRLSQLGSVKNGVSDNTYLKSLMDEASNQFSCDV